MRIASLLLLLLAGIACSQSPSPTVDQPAVDQPAVADEEPGIQGGPESTTGEGATGEGATAESTTGEGATAMHELDLSAADAGHILPIPTSARPFPFLDDMEVTGQARTYYFLREKYDDSHSEAWAGGGSLGLKSGYLANIFRIGAVAYTSQPIAAPEDRDGTTLLQSGQEGYSVVGQIYGEFKITDEIFAAVGRKLYNTPYINANDTRMTPKTFEGITTYGKLGGDKGEPSLKFGGGYISKIKELESQDFVWMSEDAGAGEDVERGVWLGGANFEHKDFSIGAANYYSDDIINIFYAETKYAFPLGEKVKLKLAGQFTDEQSTGKDLLNMGDFSTSMWGVKSDVIVGPGTLTVAFTDTASGHNMQSPWSGYPGYTSVQVKDFNRAGESALMLKGALDLGALVEGASAYALWVHGWGVVDPNFDEDEVDLNLQWTPKKGDLGGPTFRLRYAHIGQRGGGDPEIHDFRCIVNWDF